MKLALLVKYDGTPFEGFQAQPSGNTVQQHLTRAAAALFGFDCSVTGCSRTDSGVHATGFVVTVEPSGAAPDDWCRVPAEKLHRAIRPYLVPQIAVVGCAVVPDGFHPRYSAAGKRYVYLMRDLPDADPFVTDRVWQLPHRLDDSDIERMNECAALFCGTHDFCGFMASGSKITDTVRCVSEASVARRQDGIIAFTVAADGFLYNMVRIMAGTLAAVAAGAIDAARVIRALTEGDRALAGATAPPGGLYLEKVFYPEPVEFLCE